MGDLEKHVVHFVYIFDTLSYMYAFSDAYFETRMNRAHAFDFIFVCYLFVSGHLTKVEHCVFIKIMLPGESQIEKRQLEKSVYLRELEQQRRQRFFDVKQRTIGVDVAELDKQRREREDRICKEREYEAAYAELTRLQDERLDLEERDAEAEKLQKAKQEDHYRKTEQGYQRWTLDVDEQDKRLNSPFQRAYQAANSDSANERESISSCGACSGLLNLAGEDLRQGERVQRQLEQKRVWFEAHLYEQMKQRQKETERERLEKEEFGRQLTREMEAQQTEQHERASRAKQIANENLRMAEEKRRRKNLARSSLPTDYGTSNVKSSDFKGFSPEQERAILDEQSKQRIAKQELQQKELERERAFALQQEKLILIEAVEQRQAKRHQAQVQKQLAQEQLKLAQNQKVQQVNQNLQLGKNQVTPEYFSQFNTSTR